LLEPAEHVDRVERRLALVGDSFVPEADIRPGTEMPQAAFDQDRPASGLHRFVESFQERSIQGRAG
jgi:hypothetical protein